MRKCKPQYDYFGDDGTHVMCKNRNCEYSIKILFINERTKQQVNFSGCPELLGLFYQKEIWLRLMGIQKAGEQTRNLVLINSDFDKIREAPKRIMEARKLLTETEESHGE